MKAPATIDELLARITDLSSRLASMPDSTPEYRKLDRDREELRALARSTANASRHPRAIEAEIEMLEARLSEIGNLYVKKGYAEQHLSKGFSDPGAYSAGINALLASEHAPEVERITQRISELRAVIANSDEQDAL